MRVCRSFEFEAAHRLPGYNGKCKRLHGHTWTLEVEFEGKVSSDSGFVADFSEIQKFVNLHVISKLDHQYLNELELPFSDNPTCEHIVEWVWSILQYRVPRLVRVRLYESRRSYAEQTNYIGEKGV